MTRVLTRSNQHLSLLGAQPRPGRPRHRRPTVPQASRRRYPAVLAGGGSMAPVDTSAGLPAGFVDSEVGTLREVILHRPGAELRRLTPRNNDRLLFDGLPWVDRAQDEHDAFAETLRGRGVLVHLVTDLLREVLADAGRPSPGDRGRADRRLTDPPPPRRHPPRVGAVLPRRPGRRRG